MASRGDIEAGKAHVLLYLKNTLTGGLKAAQKQLDGIGQGVMKVGEGLSAAGSAIVGPMMAAVKQFADMGSVLADMSAKTGMAAGSLAELKFAAEQSGASLDDVEKAILMMQKKGISGTFDEVAAKIAAIQDPAKRTQAAFENWGKGGAALLPMIENLQALRQEARELGLVPTEEAVGMADAIGDAFDKINAVVSATVFEIGAALAPVFLPALETVKNLLVTVSEWVRENGQLTRTIFAIGAGLLAAGTVVTVIGAAIVGIGAAFGALATIISSIGTVLGAVFSPIGLAVIAITAGVVAFFKFTEAGRQAAASIGAFFAPMLDLIKTGIGGIADALMAGDIALAAQIAVTTLQSVFMNGVAAIANSIGGVLGDAFGSIATDLINGDFAGAWETATMGIGVLWDGLVVGIMETLHGVTIAAEAFWQGVIDKMREAINFASEFQASITDNPFLKGIISGVTGFSPATKGIAEQGLDAASEMGSLGGMLMPSAAAAAAAARERAAASEAKFKNRVAGGGDAAQAEADRLAKELDELRKQAANERADKEAKQPDGLPKPAAVAEMAKDVFVGFSASAALAAGGGGSPMVNAVRDSSKKQVDAIRDLKLALIPLLGVA